MLDLVTGETVQVRHDRVEFGYHLTMLLAVGTGPVATPIALAHRRIAIVERAPDGQRFPLLAIGGGPSEPAADREPVQHVEVRFTSTARRAIQSSGIEQSTPNR